MAIVGVILLLVGGGLYWAHTRTKSKIYHMQATETRTVNYLEDMSTEIAKELGPGSFAEYCEVKGSVVSDAPLSSELNQTPCVAYRMSVIREYEEDRIEKDSEGNERRVTHRGQDTMTNNERMTDFFIDDGTGMLRLVPQGADLDMEEVLDTFQPAQTGSGMIQFGGFSLSVGADSGRRRTLGYRYRELVLPLGKRVYVLGEARDEGGQLAMRNPTDKEKNFFVSLKSEEELLRALESRLKFLKFGAMGAVALGVVLIIVGLVS